VAVLVSAALFFLLPFDLEIRQAMALVAFAPVSCMRAIPNGLAGCGAVGLHQFHFDPGQHCRADGDDPDVRPVKKRMI
jgi:hypothetical protein